MPGVASHLEQLESTISESFIPALLGRPQPGEAERQVLALPSRYGGMGIDSPASLVNQFPSSLPITESLVQRILSQDTPPQEEADNTRAAKAKARADARKTGQRHAKEVYDGVDGDLQRSMDLAAEKGASNWLTCRPVKHHGFSLHKGAFRDAVCLRYG